VGGQVKPSYRKHLARTYAQSTPGEDASAQPLCDFWPPLPCTTLNKRTKSVRFMAHTACAYFLH